MALHPMKGDNEDWENMVEFNASSLLYEILTNSPI